jgi:hypothetical protein
MGAPDGTAQAPPAIEATPSPAAAPAAPAAASSATRPSSAAVDARRQALLRAALNWVGSGPRLADTRTTGLRDDAAMAPSARAGELALPNDAAPAQAAIRSGPAPERGLPPLRTPALAAPLEPLAWPGAPAQRGSGAREAVQVSIGSIHLRMDAPPAPLQAVAAPAPPPARPAARTHRDFERRLLRRL